MNSRVRPRGIAILNLYFIPQAFKVTDNETVSDQGKLPHKMFKSKCFIIRQASISIETS